jgi:predicted DNA-binding transcriptional regulator AlpA
MDAKSNRLLRLPEVATMTSLGKSTINLWVAQGKFPAPTALSVTIKVWRLEDIEQWIDKVFSKDLSCPGNECNPPSTVLCLPASPSVSTKETSLAHAVISGGAQHRQAESR